MNVGFIGLGAMGLPMAMNVIKGGYDVYTMVHSNRSPGEQLQALGARLCSAPSEIAAQCEVIITVLPADRELDAVVLGENGLLESMRAGSVLIDMTTAKGSTLQALAKELEAREVRVIDAPVSGGTTAAASGQLTLILGGDQALIEAHKPLLETMGKKLFHCGEVGAGKTVKMVNQQIAAINVLAIGEAFALGKKAGADPQVIYQVLKESSGYTRMMDLRIPGFLAEDRFEPGFKLDLMKKDVNLAVEMAMELNTPLTLGSAASQIFAAASSSGLGEKDFAAAAAYLASTAGENLKF